MSARIWNSLEVGGYYKIGVNYVCYIKVLDQHLDRTYMYDILLDSGIQMEMDCRYAKIEKIPALLGVLKMGK